MVWRAAATLGSDNYLRRLLIRVDRLNFGINESVIGHGRNLLIDRSLVEMIGRYVILYKYLVQQRRHLRLWRFIERVSFLSQVFQGFRSVCCNLFCLLIMLFLNRLCLFNSVDSIVIVLFKLFCHSISVFWAIFLPLWTNALLFKCFFSHCRVVCRCLQIQRSIDCFRMALICYLILKNCCMFWA